MIVLDSSILIDLADILIASAALKYNLPIATLNAKHFKRIQGLEIFEISEIE